MALERVRLRRVLAHAHVLAEVGHVGLLAAGHVVAAVRHAADDGAKVLLALGRVGAGRRLEDVADRAKTEAFLADLKRALRRPGDKVIQSPDSSSYCMLLYAVDHVEKK